MFFFFFFFQEITATNDYIESSNDLPISINIKKGTIGFERSLGCLSISHRSQFEAFCIFTVVAYFMRDLSSYGAVY